MSMPGTDSAANEPSAYEPPALIVLGSVEAITLSSVRGSFSDFKGRAAKH